MDRSRATLRHFLKCFLLVDAAAATATGAGGRGGGDGEKKNNRKKPFKLVIYVCIRKANKFNPFNWFAGINCLHSSQNDCAFTIKYFGPQ